MSAQNRFSMHCVIILAAGFLASCSGDGGAGGTGYSITTVEGVVVRTYATDYHAPTNPYAVEETTTFGTDQGADTYLLQRPFPSGVGGDGTLYVMDLMQAVHRFAPDGTHLGAFGRRGSGPGEFQMLQDLVVDNDTLYSADLLLGRMNLYSTGGEWLRYLPFPHDAVRTPYWSLWGPRDARRFIASRPLGERDPANPRNITRASLHVIRQDEQLAVIDTLFTETIPVPATWLGDVAIFPPYANTAYNTAVGPDLPVAWWVGGGFRIDFLDPVTTERWRSIIPHDPLPVTPAMRELTIENYRSRGQEEEARRRLEFPDFAPDIARAGLRWDASGRLWVREYPDPTSADGTPHRFFVFSRDGEWLFTQELQQIPGLILEDGFYATGTLEDGSPVIRYYRFTRED